MAGESDDGRRAAAQAAVREARVRLGGPAATMATQAFQRAREQSAEAADAGVSADRLSVAGLGALLGALLAPPGGSGRPGGGTPQPSGGGSGGGSRARRAAAARAGGHFIHF